RRQCRRRTRTRYLVGVLGALCDPHRRLGGALVPVPSLEVAMKRVGFIVLGIVATLVVGILLGLFVVKRMESGQWKMIDKDDFVKVRERIAGVPHGPSRIIYLSRTPQAFTPGEDNAAGGVSSVVAAKANAPVKVPGWKGTDKGWHQVVSCVQKLW